MSFLVWLLRQELSSSTAKKYAEAVQGALSNWAKSEAISEEPISSIRDVAHFDGVVSRLEALPVFVERNKRGHHMYSSALASFRRYLVSEVGEIEAFDKSYPEHARKAKSFFLSAGAANLSRSGSIREGRWPAIKQFDGHPDGVALAYKTAGVSRRQLYMYERHGMLTFDTSKASEPKIAIPNDVASENEGSRYPEGALSYRTHRHRERDGTLPELAKSKRLAETGLLACDVCTFDFSAVYGELGKGFIEAHHTIPVSSLNGKEKTKLEDMALVCSNCHRMLHSGPSLLSIPQLRALIAAAIKTET